MCGSLECHIERKNIIYRIRKWCLETDNQQSLLMHLLIISFCKIPKGLASAINRRKTDIAMASRKRGQTMIYKTLRCLFLEKYSSNKRNSFSLSRLWVWFVVDSFLSISIKTFDCFCYYILTISIVFSGCLFYLQYLVVFLFSSLALNTAKIWTCLKLYYMSVIFTENKLTYEVSVSCFCQCHTIFIFFRTKICIWAQVICKWVFLLININWIVKIVYIIFVILLCFRWLTNSLGEWKEKNIIF